MLRAPMGPNPTPSAPRQPRSSRPRVAVPITPPVLTPSLIPYDVIQDFEHEQAQVERQHGQFERLEAFERAQDVARDDFDPLASETLDEDEVEEFDQLERSHARAPRRIASYTADLEIGLLALEQVKQFRGLKRRSLERVLAGARVMDLADGAHLFFEGDPAASFFVVLDGTLEILRRKDGREVALRHLGRGELLGLFGLFSGQVRAAHARAIGEVQVLEVQAVALERLLAVDQSLNDRLLHFYQERLLEGFLGASRLFTEVDSIARARMIGRFKERTLNPGEVLLHPGEVSTLIAVVTQGSLILEDRPRVGQEPKQFEIAQGHFVVATGALSGQPVRLKLFAAEPTTVVLLGQLQMTELMRDYPALRNLPKLLPAHARMVDRDLYCGHTGVPGL